MKSLFLFSSLLLATSCSSLPTQSQESPIAFHEVQNLEYGKITRSYLEDFFGKPSHEHEFNQDYSIINYERNDLSGRFQRASFNVNKKTGIVLSVVWIPNSTDQKITVKDIENIFKTARFSKKKVSQNPHWYVDDYILTDSVRGISIQINAEHQTATYISISAPSNKRTPARL